MFRTFEEIPVVPFHILRQYAVMLEYTLNSRKIDISDIEVVNIIPEKKRIYSLVRPNGISASGKRSRICVG